MMICARLADTGARPGEKVRVRVCHPGVVGAPAPPSSGLSSE
jgi:hypothetical protein